MMDDEPIASYRAAFTTAPPPKPLMINKDGSVLLGAACNKSMVAFMDMYQRMMAEGKVAPLGIFSRLIAERLLNPVSKLDALIGVFSARGMGKSYSALYIAEAIARQMALITKQSPETYFTGENVISLQGGEEFARRLEEAPDRSIFICDDAGISIGNREFSTRSNRNILKIIQTCRVKRLCILFTAPAKTMIDVQLRSMLILNIRVYKSAHVHGYNILKINASMTNAFGKEVYSRLKSEAGPVTLWICPAPKPETVAAYDIERDRTARELAAGIVNPETKKPVGNVTQRNNEKAYEEFGDKVKAILKEDPKISDSALSVKLGINYRKAGYLKNRIITEGSNGTEDTT